MLSLLLCYFYFFSYLSGDSGPSLIDSKERNFYFRFVASTPFNSFIPSGVPAVFLPRRQSNWTFAYHLLLFLSIASGNRHPGTGKKSLLLILEILFISRPPARSLSPPPPPPFLPAEYCFITTNRPSTTSNQGLTSAGHPYTLYGPYSPLGGNLQPSTGYLESREVPHHVTGKVCTRGRRGRRTNCLGLGCSEQRIWLRREVSCDKGRSSVLLMR